MRNFLAFAIVCWLASLVVSCSFFGNEKPINAWNFVPRKSFAVLEANDIALADSVFNGPNFKSFLRRAKAQPAPSFLYTFQFLGDKQESSLVVSTADVKKDSLIKLAGAKKRVYENRDLYEIKTKDATFTVVFYDGLCHISTHALLAEEVVRQHKSVAPSFEEENPKLFGHPALQNDLGNLYLNWQELSKVFKKDKFLENETDIARLCQSAVMDLQVEEGNFLLSGFGIDSMKAARSFLMLFQNQAPVPVRMLSRIPDQFDLLIHIGLTDPSAWYEMKLKYQQAEPDVPRLLQALRSDFSIDDKALFSTVDNEIVKIRKGSSEAVVIELKEVTRASQLVNAVVKAASKNGKHRPESYSSNTIHNIETPDFGHALTWPLLRKSPQTSFVVFDDVLIVSTDEDYVKTLMNELDGDNTIGKSLLWQRILSNAQEESNLSMLINNDNDAIAYPLDKLVFQFTKLDRNYYASAFVSFPGAKKESQIVKTTDVALGATPFQNALFPVVNHNNGAVEILAQEQSNDLLLVDSKSKAQWRRKMSSPIRGTVHQIDFLNNGKLQYLIATAQQLHVIDRLGRDVEGFTVKLSLEPKFLSVVDYNNTKDYRFMVSTSNGDIFLYDKKGKQLEGWSPKSLKVDMDVAPAYFRISHKDYFAAVGKRGDVFLFNRRGESNPGFPLATRFEPSGELFANNDQLIFCSKDGHLLRITPKAKVEKDEVLIKNGQEAKFGLVVSHNESDFIVYRLERGQLGIFDSSESLLFDVTNPASENLIIRYFTFNNVKVVQAYDPDQQICFLMDLKGKMLLKNPLESSVLPAVAFDKKTGNVQVYAAKGNSITTVRVEM